MATPYNWYNPGMTVASAVPGANHPPSDIRRLNRCKEGGWENQVGVEHIPLILTTTTRLRRGQAVHHQWLITMVNYRENKLVNHQLTKS